MAVLKKSGHHGVVESLLVHPRSQGDITSVAVKSVAVSFAGIEGESHSGLTRESCVRVKSQYAEGTIIRNTRQISVISVEELEVISQAMGIDEIKPEWLGANICLSGIPGLTLVPPSTRLLFSGGVSLVVDLANGPCNYPADILEQYYPGFGKYFVKHATNRRGVTAWVEREGRMDKSDTVEMHVPTQSKYEY